MFPILLRFTFDDSIHRVFQGMSELPDYNKITFPENQPVPFEEILPDASREALDLLRRFLVYPSKKRIPAKEVGNRSMIIRPTWKLQNQ